MAHLNHPAPVTDKISSAWPRRHRCDFVVEQFNGDQWMARDRTSGVKRVFPTRQQAIRFAVFAAVPGRTNSSAVMLAPKPIRPKILSGVSAVETAPNQRECVAVPQVPAPSHGLRRAASFGKALKTKLCAASFLLLMLPIHVHAQVAYADTAAHLALTCAARTASSTTQLRSSGGDRSPEFCVSYVAGFLGGLSFYDLATTQRTCLPQNLTVEDAIRVFTRFLNEHSQLSNSSAAEVLSIALNRAFPCLPVR